VQILLDDRPYTTAGASTQTVGDLANEVCLSAQRNEPRFVVSIRCDSEPVAPQDLATVLQAPISQYDRLEFQTQPVAPLVRSTIEQAIRVLEDSGHAREKAADLLASGQQEGAMQEIQKFLQAWKQIHQTLMVISKTLRVDLDKISVGDASLTGVLDSLKAHFTEMREAMTQGDFVVVGDLLRYELAEPLGQLGDLLRHLSALASRSRG
jgi:hypothetical protein